MNRLRKLNLVLVIFLVILLFPGLAKAEIATVKDWIGLFQVGASHTKASTVNGNSWVYTSSCTKTAGTTPQLTSAVCSTFNISAPLPTTGDFEYRMYAYDQEGIDALISSQSFRVGAATQTVSCPVQNLYPRADGLISAPTISTNFGNPSGTCVISNQSAFAPFKIPSYSSLKSVYFSQSKTTTTTSGASTITSLTNNQIANYTNATGVTIPSVINMIGSGPTVIFIDNNLTISANITTTANNGIVFVVNGNVLINKSVTQIDAVIIAQGLIYTGIDTAANPNSCASGSVSANVLTVNGSLVSLSQTIDPAIVFCRTLADNKQAAEQINQQSKYLVLLKDMYSDTLQKWSEIQ